MDFHLAFSPQPLDIKISHQQKLLLIGSCFTEQVGNKLTQHKFRVLDNPNGILFNPVNIARSVSSYIIEKKYSADELFYQNECWNSWEHHSRFSHPDKNECLQLINNSQVVAQQFLKEADWLLVTMGSAFVYETSPLAPILEESATDKKAVANFHK